MGVKALPCSCGAFARVCRSVGMCGEKGWRVLATCGNSIFTAGSLRDRNTRAWNNFGRNDCKPAAHQGDRP